MDMNRVSMIGIVSHNWDKNKNQNELAIYDNETKKVDFFPFQAHTSNIEKVLRKYAPKGTKLYLEGNLVKRWATKELFVSAEQVILLSPKKQDAKHFRKES